MSLTLILGGARSGKSRRALWLAEAAAERRCYVATAEAHDDEMADRIARHRAERDTSWRTVEAPRDLAQAIATADDEALVVDCLTLWLTNVMLADDDIGQRTEALLGALAGRRSPTFVVSNEVGLGLVPQTPLGRAFRDDQGRLNQRVAAVADRVELVVAGLPLTLKP